MTAGKVPDITCHKATLASNALHFRNRAGTIRHEVNNQRGSGNIDIAGLTGAIEAKSISGFVDVAWSPTKGAELSLKTIAGEVYTDQDIAFSNRKENPIVGYQLHGTLKGSGPLVKLESISNDVYFRKRK